MSEQMKGNPYASNSAVQPDLMEKDGFWGIAQTVMALANEQRTANLIAAYQIENLLVNDADRQAIEREILERLGVRDA